MLFRYRGNDQMYDVVYLILFIQAKKCIVVTMHVSFMMHFIYVCDLC